MAKNSETKEKNKRAEKYDSKLSINGSLDGVLKASVGKAKKEKKEDQ